MRRLRFLLLLLGLSLAPLSGALAHAALVASEPADGSRLPVPPAALVLHFDEAVTLLDLRLAGPDGVIALPSAPAVRDGIIRTALPAQLKQGTYLASFRIISADGHPVSGGIAFGIGVAPDRLAVAGITAGANWTLPAELLRFLLYLGFALGAGGAMFRALVAAPPAGAQRLMGAAAWAGVVAALLGAGVQGGSMLAASSLLALLDGAAWAEAMQSSVFARCLLLALGLAGVALSCRMAGRAGTWLGVSCAVVAAIAFSLSGHAAAGGMVPRALLVAHVLAAAYWLGAFLPLVAVLRSRGPSRPEVVRRFAAIAMPAVAVLLLSGAAQAALRLPGPGALVGSPYGLLILGKLAAAMLMLTLAAFNHRRLTPALAVPGTARSLIRSIAAESALALSALGLTAVLSMTSPHAAPPSHDHQAAAARGVLVATEAGGLSVALEIDPAHAGWNRLALSVSRPDGSPLAAPEVWLEFSQPQAGVAGIRRRMRAAVPGRFVQEGPELALPGRWTARAEILVSDFEQVTVNLRADIAPPP